MKSQKITIQNIDIDILTYGSENDGAVKAGWYTALQLIKPISLIKSNKIVFLDIGSNVGTVSIALSKIYKNKFKAFAVEPHPILYEILLSNIKKYNLENNIIPINKAVGTGKFFMSDSLYIENTGGGCTFRDYKPGYVEVESLSLDDIIDLYIKTHIDILKIDVEGSEYDIFYNFNKWDIINKYHIEYHEPKEKIEEIKNFGVFEDKYFGYAMGLRKFIMSKLNITYETRKTRFI